MLFRIRTVLLLVCISLCVCTLNAENLRSVLQRLGNTHFIAAVDQVELGSLLNSTTLYTVFAPTNKAIDAYPKVTTSELKALIQYHFVAGTYMTSSLHNDQLLPSLLNLTTLNNQLQKLKVGLHTEHKKTKVSINDIHVTSADNTASNGVAFVIEKVISVPKDVVTVANTTESHAISQVVKLLQTAGLAKALQNQTGITFFAPNNDALHDAEALVGYLALKSSAAELSAVLLNHVVQELVYSPSFTQTGLQLKTEHNVTITVNKTSKGKTVINNATEITKTDVFASNGVIHEISGVLVPPSFTFTVEKALLGLHDSTLYELLNATGLLALLLDPKESYTLFAPTDKAFKNDAGSILKESLRDQEKLLRRHIVKGKILKFKNDMKLHNLENDTIIVTANKTYTAIRVDGEGPDANVRVASAAAITETAVIYKLNHVVPALDKSEPLSELLVIIIVCVCVPLLLILLAVVLVFDVRRWQQKRRALAYNPVAGF